ncbi:phage tail-collar fiber domain-containing protein [Vibrio sp. M260118]|uniref:phage tail-collar fiber domain-containing protein n=1 Tax=Vibrio sp. M260118 TaxID=3020896 RepID=UPI002F3F4DB2
MSQTAIPLEFEQYLQNKISLKQPTDLNEIIFAMIPDLDLSQPIDRTVSLPPIEQWVAQRNVDQIGKSGSNAVVYSVVIPGSTAPFTFNAMFLRDKNVPNSCGMVVYKATETKETGMALTKSMLMQFDGAAAAANVTIDAATWQIDYQARLKGMDEDHRLSCLDNYGHTAFVDGFDVTRHEVDQTKYLIAPGVAYVGGLRIQNALSTVQTVDNKPTTLWVDVYRDGTALSQHENLFQIVATTDDLVDYTDSENRPHYVAKLARIQADGSIVDLRVKGGLAEHEKQQSLALSKLPHYPEVLTANNQLDISLVGTTLTVADNQVLRLYGWKDFNTTEIQTKSFEIDLAKTYHLRFTEANGLELKDLSDVVYNPTSKAETDPSFDSTYDDVLLAKIEAGILTPLINKPELNADMQMVGMSTNPVHPARIFTYNWARTPIQSEGLVIGINAHGIAAFEDWNFSGRENVTAFDVLLVNLNRYMVHHKYRANDSNPSWEGGQLGVRFRQEVKA